MTPTVMQLLQDRIPLTLLLDLVDAQHLPSRAILRREAVGTSALRRPRRTAGVR